MAGKSKRNAVPKLHCGEVADFRTPYTTEGSGRLASTLVSTREKIGSWKDDYRESFKGGCVEHPEFDGFPTLNKGIQTQSQVEKSETRVRAGEKNVEFFPKYNPIAVELVNLLGSSHLRTVTASRSPKQPKDWDEQAWGPWFVLDENDERVADSHWAVVDTMPRVCHSSRVELMITDPDENILTIGNSRYVVGDGTSVRSATFLISATKGGSYFAGDSTRKRLSFAGNKDVTDVVYRIEDKANNGGGVTLKAQWKNGVREVVVLPGQAMTAGFLFDVDGNRLTAKHLRSGADSWKGLKFKTVKQVLGGPILGKQVPEDKMWDQIQIADKTAIKNMRKREGRSEEYEAGTVRERSFHNLEVTRRISPTEYNPHGFRAALADMVGCISVIDGETFHSHVIGDRSNCPYNKSEKTVDDSAPVIEADNAEVEAVEETVEV